MVTSVVGSLVDGSTASTEVTPAIESSSLIASPSETSKLLMSHALFCNGGVTLGGLLYVVERRTAATWLARASASGSRSRSASGRMATTGRPEVALNWNGVVWSKVTAIVTTG